MIIMTGKHRNTLFPLRSLMQRFSQSFLVTPGHSQQTNEMNRALGHICAHIA